MGQPDDPDLLVLLHDVARLIRLEADKRARVHGTTLAQWKLLLRLDRTPGLTQKEVADLLEVEPISVARLVDRLEAGGLIERRADAEDRRVWRLHPSPGAVESVGKIRLQRAELADDVTAGISPEQRTAMEAALRRMKCNLSRTASAAPIEETV